MRRSSYAAIATAALAALVCTAGGSSSTGEGDPAERRPCSALERSHLDRSPELGTRFLLAHIQPAGNFAYEYDWHRRTFSEDDNPVRQAGALWSLALIYQDGRDPEVARGVERVLAFFEKHSRLTTKGERYTVYPGVESGRLGTVALVALASLDYWRALESTGADPERARAVRARLDEYLAYLVRVRRKDGSWPQSYHHSTGKGFGSSSPYFDGEALLALAKAARYAGREDFRELAIASANSGRRRWVTEALVRDPDSSKTKGYYQWGSMAFYELATSGWPEGREFGGTVLDLADWMIDVHRTLQRRRNTGYAYEGIVHAYRLASERGDARAEKYRCTIELGMEKLTSWQVGSPIANAHIRSGPSPSALAIGGVQNHAREPGLRIDVTQHQMHAVILARRWVFGR